MAAQQFDDEDTYGHVDLRRARLCLDCETIFDGPHCPACTSESFVPVTRWVQPTERPLRERKAEVPGPPPQPVSESGMRRVLKKSLYLGLGAYGVWKALFEPPKPRKRKDRPKGDAGTQT